MPNPTNALTLSTIVANLAEGVFAIDADGLITYINPAAAKMLGYEHSELLGKNGHDTFHYQHADGSPLTRHECRLVQALTTGEELYGFEDVLTRKDGTTFPVLCTSSPVIQDGNIIGASQSFHDITREKQTELALRKADARKAAILESAHDAIVTMDAEGKIAEWNAVAERIFGYRRSEAVEQNIAELIIPAHGRDAHDQGLARYMATGEGPIFGKLLELSALRKDGSEFPCELIVTRIALEGMLFFTVTLRDITERKQAEKALQESESRFRIMANSLPIVVWSASPDGNLTYISEHWSEYYGNPISQSLGTGWGSFVHPDDIEKAAAAWTHSLQTATNYETEFRVRCKDEGYRWILVRAIPIYGKQGEILTWYGSNTDIHDKKAIEEEVRQLNEGLERRVEERTTQLVAINKELESFSYSVSHDLRTPLRSIDGFSQALVEDYADLLGETGKDYLQRVRKESQRMGRLIDDMLSLSRLTRGEIRKEKIDLSLIASEIAATLGEQEQDRPNVSFKIQAGLMAVADERLIHAVLQNLIGNAWKFTSNHETACIEFGATQEREKLIYYVKDDGAGFNMAYVDKLFGAFQRLHGMNEFTGSGIGLATVQRIIHRHGGEVWAEGATEEGATFYFTLT